MFSVFLLLVFWRFNLLTVGFFRGVSLRYSLLSLGMVQLSSVFFLEYLVLLCSRRALALRFLFAAILFVLFLLLSHCNFRNGVRHLFEMFCSVR